MDKLSKKCEEAVAELIQSCDGINLNDADEVAQAEDIIERHMRPYVAGRVKAVVATWREKRGGPWLDTDPTEDFKLLNEIENEGFEQAHDLQACGHSRGDFRDAGYIRGKPETYTGSEKCVGCEREKAAAEAVISQVRDFLHAIHIAEAEARKRGGLT